MLGNSYIAYIPYICVLFCQQMCITCVMLLLCIYIAHSCLYLLSVMPEIYILHFVYCLASEQPLLPTQMPSIANTNVFPYYLQAAMCFCNMAKKARGNVHAVIRKDHPTQQWKALGQARSLLIRCTRPLGQRPESPYKCYVFL